VSNLSDLENRLARLETRLVRGFRELGVDVMNVTTNPVVDTERRVISLTSLDVPVSQLTKIVLDAGLNPGYSQYTVEYNGVKILSI
jgi:hypothetical protein